MSFGFLGKSELAGLVALIALFVTLHSFGLHIPYHQDEYKWVGYAHDVGDDRGAVPHPPLTEFIYQKLGPAVGDNNFRLIPFGFGLVNLFLIFYLAKIISNTKSALWTALLFVVSFYSLLASLMVDVDGAVMPFFFLIMSIGYFRLKISNFKFRISSLLMLMAGALGGFLIKISFILAIFAIFLDFLIEKKVFADKKRVFKYAGFGVLGLAGLVVILFAAKFVFPFFNLEYSFNYWKHFANSSDFFHRGWLQTFIQFAKALLYASPLLILPLFFVDREIWQKTRLFFLFIFVGLLFYLFVFDFSIGALDRYFQFLVIPLCIISGAIFAKIFQNKNENLKKTDFVMISIISISLFALQFLNHFVPPLYPKSEWISRALSLKWDFLFPFTGGSGPTGFYISFLFITLVWVCSFVFVLFSLKKKNIKKPAIFCILILGILYNLVFVEEYLFGKINGSPYGLLEEAKAFIVKDKSINQVVVYNDIGGYEIKQIGKYARRMYVAPQFEQTYVDFFKTFSGHILYIDIPRIGENNFYSNYLASCRGIYEKKDRYITAQILNCQK